MNEQEAFTKVLTEGPFTIDLGLPSHAQVFRLRCYRWRARDRKANDGFSIFDPVTIERAGSRLKFEQLSTIIVEEQ